MQAAFLALALSLAAPALKDKPAEAPTIVGEWVAERVVCGGQPTPDPGALRYTFTGAGAWGATRNGGTWYTESRGYALDFSTRPVSIDLKCDLSSADGRTLRGIYRLDGDVLTICVPTQTHQPRPAEFESPPKSRLNLITFRPVKKD